MSRILVSGGGGKLAQHIAKHPQTTYNIMYPAKCWMDIRDIEQINDWIKTYEPDYFIHCAAITRPMFLHEENPELSIETNIVGTCNVVRTCIKYNVKLIYISTDYVYPGDMGNYLETNSIKPFNNYGRSKAAGELAVQMYDNSLILRAALCNRPFPHKQAFTDVYKNFIYEDDFCEILFKLLDEKGIINVGGSTKTVYEFASQDNEVEPISINDIETSVKVQRHTDMNLGVMHEHLRKI